MRRPSGRFLLAVLAIALIPAPSAKAAVTRVEVSERADLPIRGFERVSGRVYFAVDPDAEANQAIADIQLAPRNAEGLVEFSSDYLIFRPKSELQSNGTLLLEIVNRGRSLMFTGLNVDARGGMRAEADFGDAFTLREGYTMMWLGWQFDVQPGEGSYKLYAPVIDAVEGADLTGPVRVEVITNNAGTSTGLPYPVADPATGVLTVRDEVYGVRTGIAPTEWSYNDDQTAILYPAGFTPGRIYEFTYQAKDPAVAGLGFAAVRDFVSHLKVNGLEEPGDIQRAMAYGFSQSGRFLRHFLYEGFNADEEGRQVFELVWPHGAGGGKGSFNQRFAQPGQTSGQFTGSYYPTDIPPYTPAEILAKSEAQGVAPKLILTNGSHEYWGRAAGLNHITADGSRDLEPPDDVRIYLLAGTQHSAGGRGVSREDPRVQNPTNPMDWTFFMRAMLVAANNWITEGTEPPPSSYPRIDRDQFVAVGQLAFPAIPGVAVARVAYAPRVLDFGPYYGEQRIVSFEPPAVGAEMPVLVPQVNTDGNETSGVHMPELQAPLATYMGWNLRSPDVGAPDQLYSLIGSMVPLARTRTEREQSGDPRPSIAERYQNGEDYLNRVADAARNLMVQGFLRVEDIGEVLRRANLNWQRLAVEPLAAQ